MATTYLLHDPPRDGELLTLGSTYGGGAFSSAFANDHDIGTGTTVATAASNGRPAVASAVRVVEEALRWIAFRGQLSQGGLVRAKSFTTTVPYSFRLATHPCSEYVEALIIVSTNDVGNSFTVTSDTDTTGVTVTLDKSNTATDGATAQLYRIPIKVAAGGPLAVTNDEDVTVTFTRAAGTIYVWQVLFSPIPTSATKALTI